MTFFFYFNLILAKVEHTLAAPYLSSSLALNLVKTAILLPSEFVKFSVFVNALIKIDIKKFPINATNVSNPLPCIDLGKVSP